MQKRFKVQPPSPPGIRPGEYVVVACPKCGKMTYGVAGQKGKRCPVCRRQFPMPDNAGAPRFQTPEAACRFIQAEEDKRAGRLDFMPAASGFRPAACAPLIPRTDKVMSEPKSLDAQFATWARSYFNSISRDNNTGIPATVVIAAATKAGFASADKLLEKAVSAGTLVRPNPYSVHLA